MLEVGLGCCGLSLQCVHHFQGIGGWYEAGGKVFVAVVDVVGSIDGGCAGIVRGDAVVSRGVLGCVSRVCMAVSMVLGVAWMLMLMMLVLVGSPHGSIICFLLHSSCPSLIPPW